MEIADIIHEKYRVSDVSLELSFKIERFLFMEARVLDAEDYTLWLSLMTEDIHYWAPTLQNRYLTDKVGVIKEDRMAFFDDHYRDLERRVKRFNQPTAWTENPSIRHVHMISNVEAFKTEKSDEFLVHSTFVSFRSSRETDEDTIYGRRKDILRVDGDSFKIAKRIIIMAQNVLMSKNINTLF